MNTGTGIWVLAGHQTDYARNITREGGTLESLMSEVVDHTLDAAGIDGTQIGCVHVGSAFQELFARQGHLGALPATVRSDLWGRPAMRHEAACASGSVAVMGAVANLAAGFHDSALVVGIEIERNVPGDLAAAHLGAAALQRELAPEAVHVWPAMFDAIADAYAERYGLKDDHLRAIAAKNFANARSNPAAQTRNWVIPDLLDASVARDDALNPVVAGRIRRYDSSQISDGAAAVVLVTDAWLRRHPDARPLGRLLGWGHTTAGLSLAAKLERNADDRYVMPHVRTALCHAMVRAGGGLAAVDGMETHDCFTASEYLAIDHVGLTLPGKSWQAIEEGVTQIDGTFPINPSGGLIGGGHPVGATGVRMLLDAAKQVSGTAGEYQVEGAKRFLTLNIGGSATTTVSFVVGTPEP